MEQYLIFIGEENGKVRVQSAIFFQIGEIVRRNKDDKDWVVEKIVTDLKEYCRLVFVS